MEYKNLLIETRGKTMVVTINRPQALNALNFEVIEELDRAVTELHANSGAAGMILTGSGEKAFVAGADIAGINQLPAEQAEAFSKRGQAVLSRIENSGKPIVAAVNGFALGGGCELVMACHMRIASENAKFGQPEVNLGLIAGYGGTQRLPRLIGRSKATELLLTGDMIKADEAHRLGLVNHVVPQAELLDFTQKLLEKIYSKSPLAIALTLKSIQAGVEDFEDGMDLEAANFAKAVGSYDGREGTAAFLEKRPAEFKGE